MTAVLEPQPGHDRESELARLALAALAWLRRLDAALPPGEVRRGATCDPLALAALGVVALLRRSEAWLEAEIEPAPPAARAKAAERGDWLR